MELFGDTAMSARSMTWGGGKAKQLYDMDGREARLE